MRIFEFARTYLVSLTEAQDVVRSLGIEVVNYFDTLSADDEARVVSHFAAEYELRPPAAPRVQVRRPCGSCGG